MWNRLVSHPHVVDKNWEGYLSCDSAPEEQEVPVPSPGFQYREEKTS